MKRTIISLALSSLLFAAVGCADQTTDAGMTEADIPESVLAQLDPSLDLLIIDTEAPEWRVAEGPPPSRKATATAPFNKNHLDRWGSSRTAIDEGRITHGEPVAPETTDGMQAKAGVATETALDPNAPTIATTGVVYGETAAGPRAAMQTKSNVATETALDPNAPAIATTGVVYGETATGPRAGMESKSNLPTESALDPEGPSIATSGVVYEGAEAGPRAGMAKKGTLPNLNHSDEFSANGDNIDASVVCECVGNDCVGNWVNQNVGCDVCVVFSCADGSFPSTCVTCQ